jgi:hypothetical protein
LIVSNFREEQFERAYGRKSINEELEEGGIFPKKPIDRTTKSYTSNEP